MKFAVILSALSALVMGHSIFLAVYFWTADSKKPLSNRLLALLLLALAIRICKSIIIVAFPQSSDFWPSFGLIGMAAIGPFLWLYLQSLFQKDFRVQTRHYLHFCLSAFMLVALFFLVCLRILYEIAVYQILLYLLAAGYLLYKNQDKLAQAKNWRNWMYQLLGGVFAIWAAFTFQLYFSTPLTYIGVTAIATFVLYGLSFWVMRRRKILVHDFDPHQEAVLEKAFADLGERILEEMEVQRRFKDPQLSIGKLAKHLDEPSHQVSKAINAYFQKTFPELLNRYRIQAATAMLENNEFGHFSIEAIAFECGFRSISAFYASFKKTYQMTPAQYRKQYSVAS